MADITTFIDQVREVMILTEDKIKKEELYVRFLNECQLLGVSEEDFYKKVLKPAHKSVDWDYIESEKMKEEEAAKKRTEEIQREFEAKLAEKEVQKKESPAYLDRLIKIAFQDDTVEGSDLKKIFERAKELSQNTNDLAHKIDVLIDKKKLYAHPIPNSSINGLENIIVSTNWYSEEKYNNLVSSNFTNLLVPLPPASTTPSPKSEAQEYSDKFSGKFIDKWLDRFNILYGLMFLCLVLFAFYMLYLPGKCNTCDNNGKNINFYFDLFFYIIIIISLIRAFIDTTIFWDKHPYLHRRLGFVITLSLFFFGPILGNVLKYENSVTAMNFFSPSNILSFPIEQIQLTKNIYSENVNQNINMNSIIDQDTNASKSILYITIVDKTGSSDNSLLFDKLREENRSEFVNFLVQKYGCRYSLENYFLRDMIATSINAQIVQTKMPLIYSVVFDYDGVTNNSPYVYTLLNKNIFHTDSPYFANKPHVKNHIHRPVVTDFCYVFDSCLEFFKKSELVPYNEVEVYLNVISDFYHEASGPIMKVDQSLNDFIINGKKWKVKQVNLYKLPLSNCTPNKKNDVNRLIERFKRDCEEENVHLYDVEDLMSKKRSPISYISCVPLTEYYDNPIKLFWSESSKKKYAEGIIRICIPRFEEGDTIICSLIDNTYIGKEDEAYKFDYHLSKNVNSTYDSANYSFVNTEFQLPIVQSGNILKIRFDKKNRKSDSHFLELYSKHSKIKIKIPIEFYTITSYITNKILLILYTIYYFSFLLYFLLPMHFSLVHLKNNKKKLHFYNLFVSSILLLCILWVGTLLFVKVIFRYYLPVDLKNILYTILVLTTLIILHWYRSHLSKGLISFGFSDMHSLHPKFGRIFIKRSHVK